MYKANKANLPRNILRILLGDDPNKSYNTRQKKNLKLRYVRTKQKQMCISFQGVNLWNSLGLELKECKSISIFKTKFKKYIMTSYAALDLA
jgi:hypothetical protein